MNKIFNDKKKNTARQGFIYATVCAALAGLLQAFSILHMDGLTIFFSAGMIIQYLKIQKYN